jgi:hypothetical protein
MTMIHRTAALLFALASVATLAIVTGMPGLARSTR